MARRAESWSEPARRATETLRLGIRERFGPAHGPDRIVFGGGVTARTLPAVLGALDVDGVLVGRASLEVPTLLTIVDAMAEAWQERRAS